MFYFPLLDFYRFVVVIILLLLQCNKRSNRFLQPTLMGVRGGGKGYLNKSFKTMFSFAVVRGHLVVDSLTFLTS